MPTKTQWKRDPRGFVFNLEYPAAIHEQMQIVQQRSHAASITRVRRAVALYDLITEHISEGGQVILRDEKGDEEKLRIL